MPATVRFRNERVVSWFVPVGYAAVGFVSVGYVAIRSSRKATEPARESMVLFVPRKSIFQMRMRSHSVGLDV